MVESSISTWDAASAAALDAELVANLQAGEPDAFAKVLDVYGGRMLAVARRLLRNEEDARDAVQDACLSAFRAIDSFKGEARLGSWLHRIVVNAALMKLRRRKARPEQAIDELLPTFTDDGHRKNPKSAWNAPSDVELQQSEMREMIQRNIDRLPNDYRTILLMRDVEGLDTETTAGMLSLSQSNVKVRLHRARQALRTLLEEELV